MSPALTLPSLPVDPALSRRLKRTANTLARTRAERDALILEAHEAGASLREIGELVGLSHVGVRRIINTAHGLPTLHPEGAARRRPQKPKDE